MIEKKWWEYVLDAAMGFITKRDLAAAGAGPDALGGAFTAHLDLPTGFTVRQPPALPESRDLLDAEPELVLRYKRLKEAFEQRTGRQLFETCTWRSSTKQQNLYRIGRRDVFGEKPVTWVDGVNKRSRHNFFPSQAIDVCVDIDPGPGKVAVWDSASYAPLGPLAAEFGLVWGGDWKMRDYPHLELPAGVV